MDEPETIDPGASESEPMYPCPECSQWVAGPSGSAAPVLECPACHAQFFVPQSCELEEPDEEVAEAERARAMKEDELSALRIHQLSALRRGAYRTRSYWIIAATALVVISIKLASMTIRHVRYFGWQPRPIGYLSAMVAALLAAGVFISRITELNHEVRQSALTEPEEEPDFSTLSDGSQQWKNLEEM